MAFKEGARSNVETLRDSAIDWTKKIRWSNPPVTDFNYFQGMRMSIPYAPVIGHTEEKRSHRWWVVLLKSGTRVHDRIARLRKQECFDSYYCGDFFWDRAEWAWLETVSRKVESSRSKPIYDPNWKAPPITWGWATTDDPTIALDMERERLFGGPR